ncbi:hypothetical protein DFH29DRAFT_392067 [Suillus ampliporus]|nr:hypothetical protein DFH29DRAFT_392067 [Suillus ampliporus]
MLALIKLSSSLPFLWADVGVWHLSGFLLGHMYSSTSIHVSSCAKTPRKLRTVFTRHLSDTAVSRLTGEPPLASSVCISRHCKIMTSSRDCFSPLRNSNFSNYSIPLCELNDEHLDEVLDHHDSHLSTSPIILDSLRLPLPLRSASPAVMHSRSRTTSRSIRVRRTINFNFELIHYSTSHRQLIIDIRISMSLSAVKLPSVETTNTGPDSTPQSIIDVGVQASKYCNVAAFAVLIFDSCITLGGRDVCSVLFTNFSSSGRKSPWVGYRRWTFVNLYLPHRLLEGTTVFLLLWSNGSG